MDKRGGIYQIKNLLDNKIYIGCSIDTTRRIYLHKRMLRMGNHDNIHLQRAWNRDGEKSFAFRVIEKVANPADLVAREKYWIDGFGCLKTGYNLCAESNSQLGRSQTDYQKKTLSEFHMGKPKSAKTRRRMSLAAKGKPKSAEWRAKLSASVKAAIEANPGLKEASARGGRMTGGQNKGVPWTEEQRKKTVAGQIEAAKRPERHAQLVHAAKLATKARWG